MKGERTRWIVDGLMLPHELYGDLACEGAENFVSCVEMLPSPRKSEDSLYKVARQSAYTDPVDLENMRTVPIVDERGIVKG